MRENERRINEESNRQSRRQKLLYEAESSARQNAAVAMKWSALFDKEIPQELLHEIEVQREACDRITQSKDRLIKDFRLELKAKDDEYIKSLKKQSEDVDTLLERMGRQFTALRRAYEDELEEVETAFMQVEWRPDRARRDARGTWSRTAVWFWPTPRMQENRTALLCLDVSSANTPSMTLVRSCSQERHELMQAHETEINALMDKRREKEEQYMEARRRRVDEDQRQLEAQRVQVRRMIAAAARPPAGLLPLALPTWCTTSWTAS